MNRLCWLFLFVLFGCASVPPSETCTLRRGAFDVGSGGIRFKIADVNKCSGTLKIIFESQEKVDFKDDLKGKKKFSNKILKIGKAAFGKLKSKANEMNASDLSGVATSVFREAGNASEFLNSVGKDYDIRIQVVSQKEEAILGYYAALTVAQNPHLIVWDIGGGSMQIVALDTAFVTFEGKLASIGFRDEIVKFQKSKSKSPNPMSKMDVERATQIAQEHAVHQVHGEILSKIRSANGLVFGIGSLFDKGIREQIGKSEITLVDVLRALDRETGKTDKEIGGKYADTQVSNLALVAGYMSALKINMVRILPVNNADGVLIAPQYWTK